MQYYERIRAIREDSDLSQDFIATNVLRIGQKTYSDYELNRTRIPIDAIMKLARYYDVSMDYITGASNEKRPFPQR
ncbi:Helix-turn-helix [Anaerosporobacter mobilis DSM 15930]|jgi:transcriptional regulator with XRE-family HTH domain|uniref:Helix-turn-helix n=1 Tax=Anaerosporobacter mobilis DSM 15930 TaxID=1120996 RepID=A0A1M7N9J5_9FIRM|nr:helix-turn-helix transcriptional regulator [Anaerosporobacter mobilis]SHN00261.1 Helix-turn-helix [Anaerosporobacter mobilis DSM 15930]